MMGPTTPLIGLRPGLSGQGIRIGHRLVLHALAPSGRGPTLREAHHVV
jgi:hypothetical protein